MILWMLNCFYDASRDVDREWIKEFYEDYE
jgi:hypothetical protein